MPLETLLEIAKLPTAGNSVIHLHATDNVAIARVPVAAGTRLQVDDRDLVALEPIPAGHKIALSTIPQGTVLRRYGQVIGRARQTIEPGQHVHTHNLAFEELHFEYEFPAGEIGAARAAGTRPRFWATGAKTAAWARATTSPWWRPATARRTPRR